VIASNGRKLSSRRNGKTATSPTESRRGHHNLLRGRTSAGSSMVPPSVFPFAQRLACAVADACEATGLVGTKLYELIGEGKPHTITIGRRRLVVHSPRTLLNAENK